MGGIERNQPFEVKTMEERENEWAGSSWGRRGLFIASPKSDRWGQRGARNSGVMYRNFRTGAGTSAAKPGTSGGPEIFGANLRCKNPDPLQREKAKTT